MLCAEIHNAVCRQLTNTFLGQPPLPDERVAQDVEFQLTLKGTACVLEIAASAPEGAECRALGGDSVRVRHQDVHRFRPRECRSHLRDDGLHRLAW